MQDERHVQEGKDYEQDKENGRWLAKCQAIKDKENAQKRKQYQQDKEIYLAIKDIKDKTERPEKGKV